MKQLLSAAMPVGDAMRFILAKQFDKLCALQDAVRAPQDHEAVHDMRVACRRIKSAFRFGRAFLPEKRVVPLLAVLDALRETLGAARNLDVLSAALENYRARTPQDADALAGLAAAWTQQRAQTQNALLDVLGSNEYAAWTRDMDAFLDESAPATSPRVADEIPARLWKQYGIVRAYETRFDDAAVATLHSLRIEVKRLRYALEFFRGPLTAPMDSSPKPQELMDALISLQDILGTMQDAVVGGEFVTQYLVAQAERAGGGVSADEFHALAAYQNYLRGQIELHRAQAPQYYHALVSPWFREALGAVTARL